MSLRDPASLVRYYADRADDPDNCTSMADARIALCVARGVALDDIDPATGYNRSREAYDRCRESWVWNITQHGYSRVYEGDGLDRAVANWTVHRPDFIAGDDWLKAATKAHLAFWDGLGRPCPRESCDLHEQDTEAGGEGDVQESLFAEPPAATAPIPLSRRRSITDLQLPT